MASGAKTTGERSSFLRSGYIVKPASCSPLCFGRTRNDTFAPPS